ncbi:alpha-S1-casein isoform X4 [Sarcophilus harrisii]|uniref:alpha-S1-casein isoform X4 n=1 Tax=Sarcophilus harrisii TaxID=9305 RepID=UPI000C7D1DF7|nr:alpha-S1-casein isoform X4 [Sarcophilus harrisii]
MKLLIFSCLVALALARPDALNLVNRNIKNRELENRLNEEPILSNEVSSSEEYLYQLNKVVRPVEKYDLDKSREDVKTSLREERVRRQVEYNFNEEDSSVSNERKIEDVNEQYQYYLRRLLEDRDLYFRYLESLYYPTELRKSQLHRELYLQQPEFYYSYHPISMRPFLPYTVEVPVPSTHNAPLRSINRNTEAVFTHSEEKKN